MSDFIPTDMNHGDFFIGCEFMGYVANFVVSL